MFDYAHYVAVLRWKRGERDALQALAPLDRESVTPLLELLPGYMRPRRSTQSGLTSDDFQVVVGQMIDACGSAPVLVDVVGVANTPYKGSTDRSVEKLFSALGAAGIHAIPATGLDRPATFQGVIRDVIRIDDRGVAIRVPIVHLQDAQLARTLRDLIAYLGVAPGSVDLIVEYGVVHAAAPSFSYICHRLPELQRWRTFTVLGGSFPSDLMGFKRPGQYEIPREEWTHWVNEIKRSPTLPRRPTLGTTPFSTLSTMSP